MSKTRGIKVARNTPEARTKPFIFLGITEIEACDWDTFFGGVRAAFLGGLLQLRVGDIERARKRCIQEFIDLHMKMVKRLKPDEKFDRRNVKVEWPERIPCLDLARAMNVSDDSTLRRIRSVDNLITFIFHLVAEKPFNPGEARAVKELLYCITVYSAVTEKRTRDMLVDLEKSLPNAQRMVIHAKKFIGKQLSNERGEQYSAIAKALKANNVTAKPKKESVIILHLVNERRDIFPVGENHLLIRKSFDRYIKRHPEFLLLIDKENSPIR